jgi:hypothetical protein
VVVNPSVNPPLTSPESPNDGLTMINQWLVGGFNHLEKYESQLG